MGILSDPQLSSSDGKKKYITLVSAHSNLFCFIFYLAGIIWFCALGFQDFQSKTYFSENALLPGKLLIIQ
jgi:GPI-anchor transamidase subunit GAA1